MKKVLFSIILVACFAMGAMAQTGGSAPAKPKQEKAAKPAKATKSDADIQTCINDKFKASTTIKGGSATVSGGVATLTGEASSGGAKGGATRSAKSCGAKSVTNNITMAAKPAKAAKTADKPKTK